MEAFSKLSPIAGLVLTVVVFMGTLILANEISNIINKRTIVNYKEAYYTILRISAGFVLAKLFSYFFL